MMSEQMTITITGKDGVSQVFRVVENGATKMGDALEKAGQEGKKGMDQLGQSAEQNAKRMERAKAEATAIGAVMGTLASAVITAGSAYRNQERQIDGINRLFGDQADVILDMTERIQDFTRYSNDAARESTLLASSLISNYDLSADQLAILIERSADLAQIYGFDLPDAVQRTAGAIRGEGEAAERLGLNMSDAAIAARALEAGITNWGVPGALTEAERAAFRFQVFLEDTEATVGAAAEAADSAGGSFRQFANSMQDGVAAVGGFLGPIGEVGAELAPIVIALPIVSAGLGRLVAGLRGSAVAMAAFSAATSPLALTMGAAAIAGGTLGVVIGGTIDAIRDGESPTERLSSAFDELASGDVIGFMQALRGELVEIPAEMQTVNQALLDLFEESRRQQVLGDEDAARYVGRIGLINQEINQLNQQLVESEELQRRAFEATLPQGGVGYEEELARLREEYSRSSEEAQIYIETLDALAAAPLDPSVNLKELQRAQEDLQFGYENGLLTLDEYDAGLRELAISYGLIEDSTEEATLGIDRYIAKQRSAIEILSELEEAERDQLAWETEAERTRHANREISLETLNAIREEQASAVSDMTGDAVSDLQEMIEAARQAEIEFIAAGLAIAGWDDALSQVNLTSLASDASLLAENITVSGAALDNTFRIVVSGTDAIGQGVQQVSDWLDGLFALNDEGFSAMDALVAEQRIGWNDYEAAVAAWNVVGEANYDIQQNLLAIQAQHAPLLAELTTQQQAYVQQLADLPAQQQLIALGWMDAATAAQVMEIQTLAATAASGEFGEAGYVATQRFVEGAVAANPVLEQLLTDIGLVARDHEGNLVINFSGADGAMSEIERLTEAVVMLTDLLDDNEINGSVQIESDQAQTAVNDIVRELEWMEANGDITVPVDADTGGALGALQGVHGELDALDGSTAEVSVSAQLAGLGGAAGNLLGFAQGDDLAAALGIPDSIDVPVNVSIQGGAGVGDGTGGAQNFRDILGVPESVDTTVSVLTTGTEDVETLKSVIDETAGQSTTVSIAADVTGFEEIGSLFDILRELEGTTRTVTIDVNADTSDVDSALLGLGIGSGGGGGAAGFDAPTVYVTFDADTSEVDNWTPPEISPITVPITADAGGPDGALTVISSVLAGDKSPRSVTIDVVANAEGVTATLDAVTASAAAIPESESVAVVALADGAINVLNNVTAAANDIPESESVSVSVFGAGDAISALNGVANAANSIPGSVSTTITTYRDTVFRTFGSAAGSPFAHGGVPNFDTGGLVPFWAAEDNRPEIAHFAGGGTALLPWEGMYAAPPMTYISPSNASEGQARGDTPGDVYEIHIHGNVYGIDDLADALAGAVAQRRRGHGGRVRA